MTARDDGGGMMVRAAVDIGTNSMRLLIVDAAGREIGRWQQVTGLGRGVDREGRLSEEAMTRTVDVLADFGRRMDEAGVERRRAVATSASRDAANTEEFLDRAEQALGVRPEVIGGAEEAGLSHLGATSHRPGLAGAVVVDIGGGSTEVVREVTGRVVGTSYDIGSVRLTERALPDRPARYDQLERAAALVGEVLGALDEAGGAPVVGVAGTWTSLAAMALGLAAYDRSAVDGSSVDRTAVDRLVLDLAGRTLAETEGIPSLDPARAPVILGGALIAREVMRALGAERVVVSEHDLLDGVVSSL